MYAHIISLGINLNVSMIPDVLLYQVDSSSDADWCVRSRTDNSYSLRVSTTVTFSSVLAIIRVVPFVFRSLPQHNLLTMLHTTVSPKVTYSPSQCNYTCDVALEKNWSLHNSLTMYEKELHEKTLQTLQCHLVILLCLRVLERHIITQLRHSFKKLLHILKLLRCQTIKKIL